MESNSVITSKARLYNCDCVQGAQDFVEDGSVDLVITDPPYGIDGGALDKHYNRDESFVVDGYIDVPADEYEEFSMGWIAEVDRVLRPGGSAYIVSGYTNLYAILRALKATTLQEVNHVIWKYNFGVYTKKKFVSSHYHILFYRKPGKSKDVTFNLHSRFGPEERDALGGSLNYKDREDVWIINREYKPGAVKNKNELPSQLLNKMIQYSSNEGDTVLDFFLGGCSTAFQAVGLGRKAIGFELSKDIFSVRAPQIENIRPGSLLHTLRQPSMTLFENSGNPWTDETKEQVRSRFHELRGKYATKKEIIEHLCKEFGRGRFAIQNVLKAED